MGQLVRVESATFLAGYGGIEHDEAPVAGIDEAWSTYPGMLNMTRDRRPLIVVAGNAIDRAIELSHEFAEASITLRAAVVHKVAGCQYQI